MSVICAWCKQPLPDKPGQCVQIGLVVSHGICPACDEKQREALRDLQAAVARRQAAREAEAAA